jgi:zinc transporter ZupT
MKCRNDNIKNFNERYPSNANISPSKTIRFDDNRPLDKILGKDIKLRGIFNFKNVTKSGYLTLISGAINSFLEGIIIGIVFSTGNTDEIIPTLVAIVLGLIPKRVGDAGLLLHSNFTIWGVIFWNTAINIFILPGTGIGLVVGGMEKAGHYYALSFVLGGFLYIALTEMVPIKVLATGFVNIILQTSFLLLGLGMMYIIVFVR